MCRQYMITYNRPSACVYSNGVWSTHCDHTGRDNVQGTCGNVDFGGIRQLNYPCPNHRGLNDPQNAGNLVRQDGSHLWRHASREGDADCVGRSTRFKRQRDQRMRWAQNPDLYERGNLTPQELANLTEAEWRDYNANILNPNANGDHARRYANDPDPWGTNRPGGPLQDG